MNTDSLCARIADYSERPAPTPEAIRAAIKAERLEEVVYGRDEKGKPITFEACFKAVFNQKLGDTNAK